MEVLRDYSPSNWAVKKDLTVVTNSLGMPAALSRHAVRDIVVLGGEYRTESHITVGSLSAERSQSAPIALYSVSWELQRTVFLPSCYRMQR